MFCRCLVCGAESTELSAVVKHMVEHAVQEQGVEGGPVCRVLGCGRGFSRRHALTMHVLSHTGERPFRCATCSALFRCKRSMLRHAERQHGAREAGSHSSAALVKPLLHRCHKCFSKFTSASLLGVHVKEHHGEKGGLRRCFYCPRELTCLSKLYRHMQTHAGERPHPCSHCPKRFARKNALVRHELTHSKDFKCSHCAKRFTTVKEAREHFEQQHRGQLPARTE